MRKIQIWSNGAGNEFAICLDNDGEFRAMTQLRERYVKIVEEIAYFDDMQYDWNFTLASWVNTKPVTELKKMLEDRPSHSGHLNDGYSNIAMIGKRKDNSHNVSNKKASSSRPFLKCHHCGLRFFKERERMEHEKIWHSAKPGK